MLTVSRQLCSDDIRTGEKCVIIHLREIRMNVLSLIHLESILIFDSRHFSFKT